MRQPRISIVVPVYKAEKFLHGCIDSILSQTFKDFEVLLVDDGSPDSSGAICDNYVLLDRRVRVFHIPNGGANRAREYGVSMASSSEYITFVDSDDSLPPTALQDLYELTGEEYDIIVGSYDRNPKQYVDGEMDNLDLVKGIFHYEIASSPYAKLFRKELFDSTTFDLPRDFVMGEDLVMNLRLAFACKKKVKVAPVVVYYYNDNTDGIANTFNYTLAYVEKSYRLKKDSIPERYRMQFMSACFENILIFTHMIVGYYWEHRCCEKTAFHQLLLEDMKRYAYRPMSIDFMALRWANPVAGGAYLAYYRMKQMLKNLKKKVALKTRGKA